MLILPGLAAVAKVLISMEDQTLAPNLHYTTPNPDIPGLVDGRVKVVSQPTPWNGGYVGINSFGFGGSNVHVVLKSHVRKALTEEHPAARSQRLFTFSGRTEEVFCLYHPLYNIFDRTMRGTCRLLLLLFM